VKTVVRRGLGAVAGGVAVAATLSGCLLPIDAPKTHVTYTNDSSQDVVVVIEGLGDEFPMSVASKGSYLESIPECVGTGIRVETKSGELIGRVEAQPCPNWTLTINEDGTLDYVEDK